MTKEGWVSLRAVELTIEPGEGVDMAKTIAAALASLGWGPGEAEFNLTANITTNNAAAATGPTDPPPASKDPK